MRARAFHVGTVLPYWAPEQPATEHQI